MFSPRHLTQLSILLPLFGIVGVVGYLLLGVDPAPDVSVETARQFGAFIAKSPEIVMPDAVKPVVAESPRAVAAETSSTASGESNLTLTPEQEQILSTAHHDWSQKEFKRDERWRSEVEGLLDLAEQTHSEKLLDYLKPQILGGFYDASEQNHVYARVWAERFLKLEKREYQRGQIESAAGSFK